MNDTDQPRRLPSKPKLVYCCTETESQLAAELLGQEDELGIDIKVLPRSSQGHTSSDVCFIILATLDTITVFHLALQPHSGRCVIAPALVDLLESRLVIKCGINITNDIGTQLQQEFNIIPGGLFELSRLHSLLLAQESTRPHRPVATQITTLSKLSRVYLDWTVHMDDNVPHQYWYQTLEPAQQQSIGLDAYITISLFHHMETRRQNAVVLVAQPTTISFLPTSIARVLGVNWQEDGDETAIPMWESEKESGWTGESYIRSKTSEKRDPHRPSTAYNSIAGNVTSKLDEPIIQGKEMSNLSGLEPKMNDNPLPSQVREQYGSTTEEDVIELSSDLDESVMTDEELSEFDWPQPCADYDPLLSQDHVEHASKPDKKLALDLEAFQNARIEELGLHQQKAVPDTVQESKNAPTESQTLIQRRKREAEDSDYILSRKIDYLNAKASKGDDVAECLLRVFKLYSAKDQASKQGQKYDPTIHLLHRQIMFTQGVADYPGLSLSEWFTIPYYGSDSSWDPWFGDNLMTNAILCRVENKVQGVELAWESDLIWVNIPEAKDGLDITLDRIQVASLAFRESIESGTEWSGNPLPGQYLPTGTTTVIFPWIHSHNHWLLISIQSNSEHDSEQAGAGEIVIYDGQRGKRAKRDIEKLMPAFADLLGLVLGWKQQGWKTSKGDCPRQVDGFNCGPFVADVATHLLNGTPLSYISDDDDDNDDDDDEYDDEAASLALGQRLRQSIAHDLFRFYFKEVEVTQTAAENVITQSGNPSTASEEASQNNNRRAQHSSGALPTLAQAQVVQGKMETSTKKEAPQSSTTSVPEKQPPRKHNSTASGKRATKSTSETVLESQMSREDKIFVEVSMRSDRLSTAVSAESKAAGVSDKLKGDGVVVKKRTWLLEEWEQALRLQKDGYTVKEVSKKINRTPAAIVQKFRIMGRPFSNKRKE